MSPKVLIPDHAAPAKPAGKTGTAGAVVVPRRRPPSGPALSRGPEPPDEPRPVGNFQARAYEMVGELRSVESLEERIAIYRHAGKRLVFLAARLWPRQMPMLNGEFEFIALTTADLG